MSGTSTSYRPEIDGLRAIAILAVVGYHVGVPGMAGGFVGVDVFFVISGFLITGLLLDEHRQHGTIDLPAFYARRARRLLPAFVIVVLATLLLGLVFLLPVKEEQISLARSAIYAALYVSNVFFLRNTGSYFDGPTDLVPLLHTWSLSVEEQFYLAWPPLLIATAFAASRLRLGFSRLVLIALLVILAASFAWSWRTSLGEGRIAQAGFYLIFSRAWELALGALLALARPFLAAARATSWTPARWRAVGELLCLGGLLLIGVAITTYDPSMRYPGLAATLPTLGATAAIAGGTLAPGALGVRALSLRPMVAIGLVSYGWYLWHWPLLAVARTEAVGVRDLARDGALALTALGLAWLTYVIVEDPIRRRRTWATWSNPRLLATAAAASAAIVVVALAIDRHGAKLSLVANSRYALAAQAMADLNPARAACHHLRPLHEMAPLDQCIFPRTAQRLVLLWGDSHADHIMPLVEATAGEGGGVIQRSFVGCAPLVGVRSARGDETCARFKKATLEEIEGLRSRGLVGVVLSARWSLYQGRPTISDRHGKVLIDEADPSQTDPIGTMEKGVRTTLALLTGMGLKVAVIAPLPEQRHWAPYCLARRDVESCSVSREEAESNRFDALQALQRAVAAVPGTKLFDSFPALCDDRRCPAERDGTVLYRDDDHLTASGARSLAPLFAETARWLAEPSREATLRADE